MAHRSIGQERFDFAGRMRSASSLDALTALIDWSPVAALLDPLYPAAKGEPAWAATGDVQSPASVDLVRPVRRKAGRSARRSNLLSPFRRVFRD
ncbi:hypothetical protein [Novosphingobium olei]|uniref:hypothetical protein n=1 Tax=Novosphingobium olei TaxID=2728851 RepID=UPI001F1176BD|nr:hypothetical protein [Novosphingobium olei]